MRKALWLSAIAVALVPFAAQAQSGPSWSWGLIGGINLSNVTREDAADTKLDFDAGLTAQKMINGMWSFNIEGHYSMKGTKMTETGGTTRTLSLDYIEVPVLLRGGKESGDAKPFIEFGVSPAFKMSCKVKAETATTGIFNSCNNDDINAFDLGLVGGVGMEAFVMGRPWTLGARYTLGTMKLNDEGAGKNTNVQVLLGFRFR